MKLFYSPGACSLAAHIAFEEIGIPVELERVDLKSKKTESGSDYTAINSKGYVPALLLDSGEMITENVAVLDWIATQNPVLGFDGPLGRTRLLEALAFMSSELHSSFKPLFVGASEEELAKARRHISQRLGLLAERAEGPSPRVSVADCYLFVMLRWATRYGISIPDGLLVLRGSMMGRPAVQRAMQCEGLPLPLAESPQQKRAGVA